MKRIIALILACVFVMSVALTGCGKKDETKKDDSGSKSTTEQSSGSGSSSDSGSKKDDTPVAEVKDEDGVSVLNIYSFTVEVPDMIKKYKELHPDFPYEIKETIIATTEGAYQPALDAALSGGGADAPDIYCAESAFVLKYTQGDAYKYAASYKDLGIDVDAKLKEADIAQYTVDIGTNPDGNLVALGYQATGGAFIYRRSLAKDTWGTDDPAVIKDKIGPGWDKFFAAAADLKAKGYAIVSGDGDIWHAVEGASDKGWIVDGKLYIDPVVKLSLISPSC